MRQDEGTVPIRTSRLALRRFSLCDAQDIFTRWASDAKVTRYLRWNPHASVSETSALLKNWCSAYEEETAYYNWAICLLDKTLIGSIGVMPGKHGTEIGYALCCDYQGNGYATEALVAVRNYLTGIGVSPLWCCYAPENAASGRVIEKAGFVFSGTDVYESYDHTRQFNCRCCRYPAE